MNVRATQISWIETLCNAPYAVGYKHATHSSPTVKPFDDLEPAKAFYEATIQKHLPTSLTKKGVNLRVHNGGI